MFLTLAKYFGKPLKWFLQHLPQWMPNLALILFDPLRSELWNDWQSWLSMAESHGCAVVFCDDHFEIYHNECQMLHCLFKIPKFRIFSFWGIMVFASSVVYHDICFIFLFSIFLFLNQTESEGSGVNTACMEISELQLRMSKRSPMIFPERWDVTPCCGQGRCAAVLNHSMSKLGMTTRNDKYPEDNCKAHHIPTHYETEQCKQVLGIATGINELCGFVWMWKNWNRAGFVFFQDRFG